MDPKWIIDDTTPIESQAINGLGHGYVERDVAVQPAYGASPSLLKTYDVDTWPELLAEQEAKQSSLWHIRNRRGPNGGPIPYLDQGRYGYCWAHSAVHALMLQRAVANQPYVPLSAFSVAGPIKNGRNEGAWAALAFDRMMTHGVAPQSLWPQGNASPSLWTPSTAIEAAKNRISEGWWDAGKHPGLRNLSIEQVFTLLIDNVPTPVEFNWWTHSVLGLRFVDTKRTANKRDIHNRYALDILNSWVNYGDNGVGRITGQRMRPDSAVALTVAFAA
jgi:hypothetical protein